LFLTKPLGTGLVLTAAQNEAAGEEEVAAAVASMTNLNAHAADVLRSFGPSAVTDVTGFGLFGHAYEMAERSSVKIVLDGQNLPALPGALAAARRGLKTGGDQRNRDYLAGTLKLDGVAGDSGAPAVTPRSSDG